MSQSLQHCSSTQLQQCPKVCNILHPHSYINVPKFTTLFILTAVCLTYHPEVTLHGGQDVNFQELCLTKRHCLHTVYSIIHLCIRIYVQKAIIYLLHKV